MKIPFKYSSRNIYIIWHLTIYLLIRSVRNYNYAWNYIIFIKQNVKICQNIIGIFITFINFEFWTSFLKLLTSSFHSLLFKQKFGININGAKINFSSARSLVFSSSYLLTKGFVRRGRWRIRSVTEPFTWKDACAHMFTRIIAHAMYSYWKFGSQSRS